MKYLGYAVLLAFAAILNVQCGSAQLCDTYFTYFNGSCYRATGGVTYTTGGLPVRLEGLPFAQAELYCKQLNPDGHLVVINDAAEHSFIFNQYAGVEPNEMWIGAFYNITIMAYQWVNGDPMIYTGWEPYHGEPVLQAGRAGLMFLSEVFTAQTTQTYGYGLEVSDYWNTEMADEVFPFICEYPLPLQMNTTTDTNTTTPTANPNATTTTQSPITNAATFAPQVLFQREPQPVRLSDFVGFGGLHEITAADRRRGFRPRPQAYKSYAEKYNYGYPVMP